MMIKRWFTILWWKYLFSEKPTIKMILCRIKGHEGPIWFNSGGLEPNMKCQNCGEDLG
mgnify:CR=1 FL=1